MVVPVRIEGLEQTPFTPAVARRRCGARWFPKVTVTMLEPVKLTVDPALKGKQRRQAAGAALYEIMSDLVFRTTSTDRTMFEAVIEAAAIARHGPRRGRGSGRPARSPTRRLLLGAAILGRKLMPLARRRQARSA